MVLFDSGMCKNKHTHTQTHRQADRQTESRCTPLITGPCRSQVYLPEVTDKRSSAYTNLVTHASFTVNPDPTATTLFWEAAAHSSDPHVTFLTWVLVALRPRRGERPDTSQRERERERARASGLVQVQLWYVFFVQESLFTKVVLQQIDDRSLIYTYKLNVYSTLDSPVGIPKIHYFI